MASRQAHLLSEGWRQGLLDFEYKHPFSRAREQYILGILEAEAYKDAFKTRLQMESALASGVIAGNPKVTKIPYDTLEHYLEIALPYQFKKAKIDVKFDDDMKFMLQDLQERQRMLDLANNSNK